MVDILNGALIVTALHPVEMERKLDRDFVNLQFHCTVELCVLDQRKNHNNAKQQLSAQSMEVIHNGPLMELVL